MVLNGIAGQPRQAATRPELAATRDQRPVRCRLRQEGHGRCLVEEETTDPAGERVGGRQARFEDGQADDDGARAINLVAATRLAAVESLGERVAPLLVSCDQIHQTASHQPGLVEPAPQRQFAQEHAGIAGPHGEGPALPRRTGMNETGGQLARFAHQVPGAQAVERFAAFTGEQFGGIGAGEGQGRGCHRRFLTQGDELGSVMVQTLGTTTAQPRAGMTIAGAAGFQVASSIRR